MNEQFNPGSDPGDLNVSAAMNDNYPSNRSSASLSRIRPAGLLVVLGFSIAIAVAWVLWVQTSPDPLLLRYIDGYKPGGNIDFLDEAGASYKVGSDNGNEKEPIDQADQVKHRFPAEGLSSGNNSGNGIRDPKNLEREIARSIMTIQHIKTARVLLAIPESTETAGKFSKPSASAMVTIAQGHTLKKSQKKAIIHLIAASVPKLEAEQVTLVDHRGRLLSLNDSSAVPDLNARQSSYKEDFEEDLTARITHILSPYVDAEGLRVQVSADLDYAATGRSEEKGDSKLPDTINKQSTVAQRVTTAGLTEQGSSSESVQVNPRTEAAANSASVSGPSRRAAKNKTAKQEEVPAAAVNDIKASLRRLSVAVVVDDQTLARADDGPVKPQPVSRDEIDRFSGLVKQAVGFDSSRGDQLTLTHVAFKKPVQAHVKPEPPIWKQAWFYLVLKQLTIVLALLLLFLGIINPLIRYALGFSGDVRDKNTPVLKGSKSRDAAQENGVRHDQNSLSVNGLDDIKPPPIMSSPDDASALLLLDTPQNYRHRLEYTKKIADADAKLVSEVIKSWINKDG